MGNGTPESGSKRREIVKWLRRVPQPSNSQAASSLEAGATRTIFARLGFVNTDVTARQRRVVHFFDRFARFVVVRHFYETEAFRTASLTVGNNGSPRDFSECTKCFVQFIRGNAVGQISNIDIHKKFSLDTWAVVQSQMDNQLHQIIHLRLASFIR